MHLLKTVAFAAAAFVAAGGRPSSAAAVSFAEDDAKIAYETADAFVRECTPRHSGTLRARLAAEWLLDRASRCGADASIDSFRDKTPCGERLFSNVVMEFKGTRTNAAWIVVMSHFDTPATAKQPCAGANDGASTSGLLVALAGAIRRSGPHPDNIALVWTDGEECCRAYGPDDGFHGSRRLVANYRKLGRRVKTALCLDMLGDKDLAVVVPSNSTPVLKKLALKAAEKAGLKGLLKVDESIVVSDDHSAFLSAGCPAINFIDFSYGPGNSWWHTPDDTMANVSQESLCKSGRLVAAFLNAICYN